MQPTTQKPITRRWIHPPLSNDSSTLFRAGRDAAVWLALDPEDPDEQGFGSARPRRRSLLAKAGTARIARLTMLKINRSPRWHQWLADPRAAQNCPRSEIGAPACRARFRRTVANAIAGIHDTPSILYSYLLAAHHGQARVRRSRSAPLESHAFRRSRRACRFSPSPRARAARGSRKAGPSRNLRADRSSAGAGSRAHGSRRRSRRSKRTRPHLRASRRKKSRAWKKNIFELAGCEFNINSPQQLAEILFDKLNLAAAAAQPQPKSRSTAAEVLEELALLHDLPKKVLEYRELAKLKSTYADALPRLIHPDHRPPAHALLPDGRRHRPPQLLESQPAKYSRPHRAGPRNPRRLCRSAGPLAAFRRLFADRAAHSRASLAKIPFSSKRSAAAKTFTPAPRRKFSASARSRRRANIAASPKSSISASFTAFPPFGLAQQLGIEHERSREIHRRVFRAL